ncbi:CYTH domain-containing protein [Ralstonia sp. 25mfcol4.1]|uniref:CYTH domain-containing protein n=1 Tax=Burkholderiaceae TaxID=119060 RepID=UPI0003FD9EAC|nr:CYTH domain-containing protein [Ralstonia sp. 25mfcol4.1]SDP62910.1 CYTH domain-containing protein [Ralstonia sp. 25mfcol4.1]
MAKEIELKLALPDAALAAVAAWLDAHGEARGEVTMLNVYLDTPTRELARARAALRLRRKDSQWLQTLKTAGKSGGGLAARHEWETEIGGEAIEPDRFEAPARAVVAPLADRLAPVFRTDFVRRTWIVEQDGERIEAAIDTGTISAPGIARTEPIQELELEWLPKKGAQSDKDEARAEAVLHAFSQRLGHVAPLVPMDLSKAARGYRLTDAPDAS